MERTLILIKPDGIERKLMGEIISFYEKKKKRSGKEAKNRKTGRRKTGRQNISKRKKERLKVQSSTTKRYSGGIFSASTI
jgi:hypothetical protein